MESRAARTAVAVWAAAVWAAAVSVVAMVVRTVAGTEAAAAIPPRPADDQAVAADAPACPPVLWAGSSAAAGHLASGGMAPDSGNPVAVVLMVAAVWAVSMAAGMVA